MFRHLGPASFPLHARHAVCTIRSRKLKVREPPVPYSVSTFLVIDVWPESGSLGQGRSTLARPAQPGASYGVGSLVPRKLTARIPVATCRAIPGLRSGFWGPGSVTSVRLHSRAPQGGRS